MGKKGLPWLFSGKESTCQCRRHGSDPWSGKIQRPMEQLSLGTTAEAVLYRAPEPQVLNPSALEPVLPNKTRHCNEMPIQHNEK